MMILGFRDELSCNGWRCIILDHVDPGLSHSSVVSAENSQVELTRSRSLIKLQ